MADQQKIAKWREEIRQLGKYYFEVQDMLRLGFIKLPHSDIDKLKHHLRELQKINRRLQELKKELDGIPDVTPLIKEIRKNRIERVRAARAIRKAEKAEAKLKAQAQIREKRKNTPYYLGDDLPKGLSFDNAQEKILSQNQLSNIVDLLDLAEKTKLTREEILWLCYHRRTSDIDHYTRFQIPKRKGGHRSISAPKPKLRQFQNWILENVLNNITAHDCAMAYRKGHAIIDNANSHLHKKLVIRLDLKDFFPSITFSRVNGLFKSLGYSDAISMIFALVCTDAWRFAAQTEGKLYHVALGERYLPQGASTSPAISNLITRGLDNRLHKLALSLDWTYTRYADDLIFSTNSSETTLKSLLGLSKKIISEENFTINPEKTLVMRPQHRQSVTGILVNHNTSKISRRDLRNFRAFLHQYTQKGAAEMSRSMGKDATQYARGYWAFVNMVNPTQAEKLTNKYTWLSS